MTSCCTVITKYTGVIIAYFHCVGIFSTEKNDWNKNVNGNSSLFVTFSTTKVANSRGFIAFNFLMAVQILMLVKWILLSDIPEFTLGARRGATPSSTVLTVAKYSLSTSALSLAVTNILPASPTSAPIPTLRDSFLLTAYRNFQCYRCQ